MTAGAELLAAMRFHQLTQAEEAVVHDEHGKLSGKLAVEDEGFARSRAWFETFVRGLDAAAIRELMMMITGVSALPATSQRIDKFAITVEIYTDPQSYIPTASTCTRTLLLPAYANGDEFERKMEWAIKEFRGQSNQAGGAEFGFG